MNTIGKNVSHDINAKLYGGVPAEEPKQEVTEPILTQGEVAEIMTQEVAEVSEQGATLVEDEEFTQL